MELGSFLFLVTILLVTVPSRSVLPGSLQQGSQVKVVHVNKNGINQPECLEGSDYEHSQPEKSCQTMEFVADHIGRESENIKIFIETAIKVMEPVRFHRCNNIFIHGKNGSFPTITCNCFQESPAAGFVFVDVQQLYISHISFVNCCGSLSSNLNASLVLQGSSDITLESVTIGRSTLNCGLMLVDCYGVINIRNSTIIENDYKLNRTETTNNSFAALHMQFSEQNGTNVSIINCKFERNHSPKYSKLDPAAVKQQTNLNGYSLGGGMGIVFMQKSNGIVIDIQNCTFKHNIASNGGGLCVHFQDEASNNKVMMSDSFFLNNSAVVGGGGVMISLGQKSSPYTKNNIQFNDVTFESNSAGFGGGMSIAALFSRTKSHPGELLRFTDCTWRKNFGLYSPAVDVSPFRFQQTRQFKGFLPVPLFINSHVMDHYIHGKRSKLYVTQGVFVITHFSVHYQGSQRFRNNSYSALYLTSGRAIFEPNSEVLFSNNVGINGGAISVNGFSAIAVNDNSHFHFVNNSAVRFGGAVYYASSDQREYFEGRSCFLEYVGTENDLTVRNLSFNFTDNRALRGVSIYSASLFSCYFAYVGHFNNNLAELLDHIGYFQFDRSTVPALATGIRYVTFEGNSTLFVIPGKPLYLPFGMYDEFESDVESGYGLRIKGNRDIYLSNYFTVNNETSVFGVPDQTAEVIINTPQNLYNIEFNITIHLLPCPPGFFFGKATNSCICSADVAKHSYPAITKCDHTAFRTYVQYGFWAGYHPTNTKPDPDHLYTALFPFSHSSYGTPLLMPNDSDSLSLYVCGNTRKGVLCWECQQGYSTYYHSRNFTCGDNRYCKFGILFYFLSEIIPFTIFFTVVITFGVSFSSGSLNGLVFFSHILDTFSIDLEQFTNTDNKHLKILNHGYRLIYGVFNLDFFSVYPFCLWKGATTMDLLAFKYVTTFFALIVILLIVAVTNYSSKRISRLCRLKTRAGKTAAPNSSMTHGISTLLIISYSQCTRATFSILTTVYLRSKPGIKPIQFSYYGGLPYFEGKHLLYAIPAIVVCLTVVILPPLCLLLYPSLLHLLALCNLSEHSAVNRIFACVGISRLMPLFDSFQGCYKDKLRFFSGLYFVYRVAILLAFTYGGLQFSVATEFLVLIMLGIHSTTQPYQSWKHNVIDSLIFLNLAIINGITVILKFSMTRELVLNVNSIIMIQIAFIYLPIIVLLFFGLKQLAAKTVKCKHKNERDFIEQEHENVEHTEISHTSIELVAPLL